MKNKNLNWTYRSLFQKLDGLVKVATFPCLHRVVDEILDLKITVSELQAHFSGLGRCTLFIGVHSWLSKLILSVRSPEIRLMPAQGKLVMLILVN